ncbi:MAG TPA: DUF1289 domain-containing protein [Burkholderiales bacterium]|nr:DUF1289 domain-containing protein [Burkholderiales bacterium]
MSLPPVHIDSPCRNVCQMDPSSGLCLGCRRTLQEIADWLEMTPEEKRATLERVVQRACALGQM